MPVTVVALSELHHAKGHDPRKLLRGNGVTAPPAPAPASPPQLDGPAAERFARLWAAYPEAGRIDTDRAAAERHFGALGTEDQDLAVTSAGAYAAHVRRQEARPKALHTWLRQRRFQNLAAPAAAPTAARPERVFVREDTPAWDAWVRHERQAGRVPPLARRSDLHRAEGWWFPSAWPPESPPVAA